MMMKYIKHKEKIKINRNTSVMNLANNLSKILLEGFWIPILQLTSKEKSGFAHLTTDMMCLLE